MTEAELNDSTGEKLMYAIEKNVPIPTRATRPKYPLAQMEVGDSVVIDKPQPSASSLAASHGRTHGKKFTCARIDANTTRVWRIA